MGMPPLMVTGRIGALGKTKRQARSPRRHEFRHDGFEIMAVGAQAMQPDDRGVGLRRGFDFNGFQHLGLNVPGAYGITRGAQRRRFAIIGACRSPWSHLRRYAIARSLFKPTTLARAIEKLGFVQADPIRAPARAQDLTLRHRVAGYRAGDLERRYPKLRWRKISSSTTAFCRARSIT